MILRITGPRVMRGITSIRMCESSLLTSSLSGPMYDDSSATSILVADTFSEGDLSPFCGFDDVSGVIKRNRRDAMRGES